MVEIIWTPQSIEDMENIAEYISKDSLKYALIQVEDFFETATILEHSPKVGRIVPELRKKNIRELFVGFYRLIYRINDNSKIDVLTVYHTSRHLKSKMLKKK